MECARCQPAVPPPDPLERACPIGTARIKTEGEGEETVRSRGGSQTGRWRKRHIRIDEDTLEAQAVEAVRAEATELALQAARAILEDLAQKGKQDPFVAPAIQQLEGRMSGLRS